MNVDLVDKIANAVLYEGYMLYPYRPSAVKNRQRWNFGVLYPQAYSDAQRGAEAATMQTECLMLTNDSTVLEVRIRFLQLLQRQIGRPSEGVAPGFEGREPDYHPVDMLEVEGQLFQSWQEAVEREVVAPPVKICDLERASQHIEFSFPAHYQFEPLLAKSGAVVGRIERNQEPIAGEISLTATRDAEGLAKITVQIANRTALDNGLTDNREQALLRSTVSTHTILGVRVGEFVSQLDPPEELRAAASACRNVGTWPVLVGEEKVRDTMLSSPIILYDYPQIAPESAGNLFDGTEIDEILTLRIMTLTDEEKREMRGADALARQLLERTETLGVEQFMKMHGGIRK